MQMGIQKLLEKHLVTEYENESLSFSKISF